MHLKLFELLQSGTASSAAVKMIAFARNNDVDELQRVILQLFADFVDRTYTLTTEDVDSDDFDEVAVSIYRSQPYGNKLETNSTIKDFFTSFLERGHQSDVSNKLQEADWIDFVTLLATHEDIPENCAFKANALQLLSLLLNPLAKCVNQPGNEELAESLQDAIKLVSTGFAFIKQSSDIADEFVEAMEAHPELFILGDAENLELYKKLMLKENSALHITALKSLRNLCNNQNLHVILENFFFDEPDDSDDSFRSILDELLTRKSLKMYVIQLVKAIRNLPSERNILSDESRDAIYLNIFDANRKVVVETVELMVALGDDVWLQTARLLNTSDPEHEDITALLKNLSSSKDIDSSADHLLKLLCDKLDDHKDSQRLASILVAQARLQPDCHKTILQNLEHLLGNCAVDELTFTLLLDLFEILDEDIMSEHYKRNVTRFEELINCLTTAFAKFGSAVTLHNIISSLANLSKMFPGTVLDSMRLLFNTYYTQFLAINELSQTDGEHSVEEFVQIMTKLSNILEFRGWNILTEKNYSTLAPILEDLSDNSPPHISFIACRFYANFIKQVWARFILNKTVPLKTKELAGGITSFSEGIAEILIKPEMDLNEGFFMIRSLLDVLVMFQPTMKDRHEHKIFKKVSIALSKEKAKELGTYVAKAVFGLEKSEDRDEVHKREMILLSWISFCKNYANFPSMTASDKIVMNYRVNDPFKASMELLLQQLLAQKPSFEQTVSIVVYHFSNSNDSAGFRAFFQALDDFMTRAVKDTNQRSAIKLAIGRSVLKKLTGHIINFRDGTDENRLEVLDFVKIIVKSLDPSLKVTLLAAVPRELATMGLSDEEKDFLETFKASLRV